MAEERAQERTEKATPQRRRRAREKGQVAKSPELNSVLMLCAGLLLMSVFLSGLIEGSRGVLGEFIRMAGEGVDAESRFGALFYAGLMGLFRILAPVLVGTVIVAVASNVAQVGFHITPAAIEPKLQKLNPVEGFKRVFGKRGIFELFKGLTKITVVGLIAFFTYRSKLDEIAGLMFALPAAMVPESLRIGAVFMLRAVVALAVLAVFDYAWQKWEFEKSIRMSLQDIKEELKENEGDPHLKSRMRSIQQRLASRRMMEDVKSAALVITNPTHYAVALDYDEKQDPAPRVVAKGIDDIARRIKSLAREHQVPVVEKPELARLLYRECNIGQAIPAALYEAVAEVLAYVYSLAGKGRR